MKRSLYLVLIALYLVFLLILMVRPGSEVQALPEYSAQTGETCATCHISPSGGGARTPRGQAWIADGKPGAVLDLLAALELLGVNLDVDPAEYINVPEEISPAQPLDVEPGQSEALHQHLSEYPGN